MLSWPNFLCAYVVGFLKTANIFWSSISFKRNYYCIFRSQTLFKELIWKNNQKRNQNEMRGISLLVEHTWRLLSPCVHAHNPTNTALLTHGNADRPTDLQTLLSPFSVLMYIKIGASFPCRLCISWFVSQLVSRTPMVFFMVPPVALTRSSSCYSR